MSKILVTLVLKIPLRRGKARILKLLARIFSGLQYYSINSLDGGELYVNLKENAGIGLVLQNGILPHEKGLLNILTYLIEENSNFWDVGSNYGYYPWKFENKGCKKLVVFEPNRVLQKHLMLSFGKKDNVMLNFVGLGRENGVKSFFFDKEQTNLGSFVQHGGIQESSVQVYTVDHFRQVYGPPNIMKIDVEGFEAEVIAGYGHLNKDYPLLIIEWIQQFQSITFDEFLKFFDETWKYYYIGNDGNLYEQKSASCGSDLLFISDRSLYSKKIEIYLNKSI